jgi:Glycosyl transferase family 2
MHVTKTVDSVRRDQRRWRPYRFPLRFVKKALRSRRLVLMELRNKVLLGPSAVVLKRFENREVTRLSSALALPEAQVAVVVAAYRRPELLLAAVRSALGQSFSDLVVLVVDDGGGMLPAFPPDPRLAVCSLSANTGVPGITRNVGIRLTRSKYIAFLDDDNEWEPCHLEVALQLLEKNEAGQTPGFVYTALRRCLPDGRTHDVLSVEFDRRKLGLDNFVDTNAMVIRRFPALHWSRIRRGREVLPAEDWELAYRLSRTVRAEHVSVPTVRYRIHRESTFTNWDTVL